LILEPLVAEMGAVPKMRRHRKTFTICMTMTAARQGVVACR
jgi:hypothetical protein